MNDLSILSVFLRMLRVKSLFSNGERDPWSGAGVQDDINEKVIAVWIKDGTHGSDMKYPPISQSAKKAQEIERQHIKRWIEEAREKYNNKPLDV